MDDEIKRVYDRLKWIEQDDEAAALIQRLAAERDAAEIGWEASRITIALERKRAEAAKAEAMVAVFALPENVRVGAGPAGADAIADAARKREGA